MFQILKRSRIDQLFFGRIGSNVVARSRAAFATQTKLSENDVEEIRIPVPWGHIAGKWWGKKDGIPMLAIHGWQDNANTYDRLAPLLNVSSFLAVDMPGHGQSSHLPSGKIYNFLEYMYIIRRIVDHFKWEKYSLLGQSFGSALAFVYSSLYSKEIECFISVECARSLLMVFTVNLPQHLADGVDKILDMEKKVDAKAPYYTLPEIIHSVVTGSLGSINSAESAMVLLPRATSKFKASEVSVTRVNKKSDLKVFLEHELKGYKEVKSGVPNDFQKIIEAISKSSSLNIEENKEYVYQFTKDPRIKLNQFGNFNKDLLVECSKFVTCPVLAIRGKDGFLNYASKAMYEKTNEIVKSKSKYFEFQEVEGNHHCHLNTPENVAPVVNNFLEKLKKMNQ